MVYSATTSIENGGVLWSTHLVTRQGRLLCHSTCTTRILMDTLLNAVLSGTLRYPCQLVRPNPFDLTLQAIKKIDINTLPSLSKTGIFLVWYHIHGIHTIQYRPRNCLRFYHDHDYAMVKHHHVWTKRYYITFLSYLNSAKIQQNIALKYARKAMVN